MAVAALALAGMCGCPPASTGITAAVDDNGDLYYLVQLGYWYGTMIVDADGAEYPFLIKLFADGTVSTYPDLHIPLDGYYWEQVDDRFVVGDADEAFLATVESGTLLEGEIVLVDDGATRIGEFTMRHESILSESDLPEELWFILG
jgi:hypothetical protein